MTDSKWTPEPKATARIIDDESEIGRSITRMVACTKACASLDDPEADIRTLCYFIDVHFPAPVNDGRAPTLARRWLAAHGGGK